MGFARVIPADLNLHLPILVVKTPGDMAKIWGFARVKVSRSSGVKICIHRFRSLKTR